MTTRNEASPCFFSHSSCKIRHDSPQQSGHLTAAKTELKILTSMILYPLTGSEDFGVAEIISTTLVCETVSGVVARFSSWVSVFCFVGVLFTVFTLFLFSPLFTSSGFFVANPFLFL